MGRVRVNGDVTLQSARGSCSLCPQNDGVWETWLQIQPGPSEVRVDSFQVLLVFYVISNSLDDT